MAVEKWSRVAAVLLAVFFLGTSLYIASKRLFWNDEIYTVVLARLPDLSTIWSALLAGADHVPIPGLILVRLSELLFGQGEFAARLPSVLALAAGMLVTFDCVRRLTDGLHGLIAEAVLACSFLPFYGYEARMYAVYFLFSALALRLWLHTAEASRAAACAFGAVFMIATMFHYYFILGLVPYLLYELVRRHKPSSKTIAGVAGSFLALLLLSPQFAASRKITSNPGWWATPSLGKLHYVPTEFFPAGMFLLGVMMVGVAVAGRRGPAKVPAMSDGERLSWLFLTIPVAGYFLAELVTNSFSRRYFINALPGIAMAFSCLVHRQFGETRRASIAIAVLLVTFGLMHQVRRVRSPEVIETFGDQQGPTKNMLAWEATLESEGKHYIAIPEERLLGMEAWYYSKHPERYAILLKRGHSTSQLAHYVPRLTFWTVEDLKRSARESAVVEPELSDADVRMLKDAGIRPVVRVADPIKIIYLE